MRSRHRRARVALHQTTHQNLSSMRVPSIPMHYLAVPAEPILVNGIDLRQWFPLIIHVARKRSAASRGAVKEQELIGDGFIGLRHAAEHYQPEREVQFKTYAHNCIWHCMTTYMETSSIVSRKQLQHCRLKDIPVPVSSALPLDQACHRRTSDEVDYNATLDRMLACIPRERHRVIFVERVVKERKLREIASEYGITVERVRQIALKAIRAVRLRMGDDGDMLSSSRVE